MQAHDQNQKSEKQSRLDRPASDKPWWRRIRWSFWTRNKPYRGVKETAAGIQGEIKW